MSCCYIPDIPSNINGCKSCNNMSMTWKEVEDKTGKIYREYTTSGFITTNDGEIIRYSHTEKLRA